MIAIEDTLDRETRAALARADSDAEARRAQDVLRERGIEGTAVDAALEALAAESERFLRATKDLAREAVAWERRRCPGVPPRGRLAGHDLVRIVRAPALDGAFRAERAVPVVDETLRAMKLDVRAAVAPGEGLPAWRTVLHAAGRAIATAPALGALLEGLVVQPIWLERRLEIARFDVETTARTIATARLLDARRTAALLAWEVELCGGVDEPAATFQARMTDAMDAEWLAGRWAADLDPGPCAERLRAWLAEPALLVAVRDRHDEDWFANPRTGAALPDAARSLPEAPTADALVRRCEELLA